MSLDIYLTVNKKVRQKKGSGIFIREDGKTKEISEKEWYKRYPNREPVRYGGMPNETYTVYSDNITHNLGGMASEAGIYYALWRPEEIDCKYAKDIIQILSDGLDELRKHAGKYKVLEPSNGWGTYIGLVHFVEDYLAACLRYPEAEISVSR